MVCVYCGSDTTVVNSRLQKRANNVWRRRKCQECQAVFTSIEAVDLEKSLVVESSGLFTPFQRDKLFAHVYDSLKHRKTALSDATALTDTVLSQVLPKAQSGMLPKAVITRTTLEVLKRFDKTAATFYAAYHPVT